MESGFCGKFIFAQIWAKRIPKWGILHFLKILSFVFPLKKRQNGSSFNSLFFVTNLIPDKILVLELLAKMFLTNQIAGFFKV